MRTYLILNTFFHTLIFREAVLHVIPIGHQLKYIGTEILNQADHIPAQPISQPLPCCVSYNASSLRLEDRGFRPIALHKPRRLLISLLGAPQKIDHELFAQ